MIKLFVVYSLLESKERIIGNFSVLVNKITEADSTIEFAEYINSFEKISEQSFDNCSGVAIIPATGGSEAVIKEIVNKANLPSIIFANSGFNSFAASLEAYSFLKHKYRLSFFYWNNPVELLKRVKDFSIVCSAIQKINCAKIGLIGEPSDWLLTSKEIESFGEFNTILAKYKTEELVTEIQRSQNDNPDSLELSRLRNGKLNVDKSSLSDSFAVYAAVKNFTAKNMLDGITIRCFDLLKNKYTACIAMAMCNDEGIVSGCEGDLHAMFSMILGFYLTGEPCWMANPSSIDKKRNHVTFAHCTVPTKFLDQSVEMEITTHMESGLSCAIGGAIKKEEVTIFRTGGNFDKLIAVTGKVVDTKLNNPSLCRTQAVIKLNCSLDDWVNNTLGNHHIITYGNIKGMLEEFSSFTGLEFIGL
ncbi:MAG: hypothetical protein V1720_18685 [bacterium]